MLNDKSSYILLIFLTFIAIVFINSTSPLLIESTVDTPKAYVVEPVVFQESTVPCVDTEDFGSGWFRDRICVDGGSAHCQFENYNDYNNEGTCTFDSDGDHDDSGA